MPRSTDIVPVAVSLYYLPIQARVPLKFGPETTTGVTCARVRMTVADGRGTRAHGWGETPLSVQWVWPSRLGYHERHDTLITLCDRIAQAWMTAPAAPGHPIEIGHWFLDSVLPELLEQFNRDERPPGAEPVPWLAALVCASAFDIAVHDAFGMLHGVPTYDTYNDRYMSFDLAHFLSAADGTRARFENRYPAMYLRPERQETIPAWHLIGGADPIDPSELTGAEPDDGYPVLLRDWIRRDGLRCLKIKLKGDSPAWDYDRLVRSGQIATQEHADWLTADFNCTVHEPEYVNEILDRLMVEHPRIFGMLLYVEQPFPYDLEMNRIDVHSVSARKPLFMDESAHDWKMVRLGRELGWTGVALKTCKTQTGALLSLCWARAHGMTLMVQDLSNPMLAQIPHALLGAHAGTIMGVESNGMQYYPAASGPEATVHPGLYRRHNGCLDLSTIRGPGFGYRIDEIDRALPPPHLTRER